MRPQAPGFASTPATSSSRAPSARRMLRKPGGATSTDAIGEPGALASVASSAAIASAIRRGAIRYGRASFIARPVARSPCSACAGRSISTGGSSAPVEGGRQGARGDGADPGGGHGVADALARGDQEVRLVAHQAIVPVARPGAPGSDREGVPVGDERDRARVARSHRRERGGGVAPHLEVRQEDVGRPGGRRQLADRRSVEVEIAHRDGSGAECHLRRAACRRAERAAPRRRRGRSRRCRRGRARTARRRARPAPRSSRRCG